MTLTRFAWDFLALLGTWAALTVMLRTEYDQINKDDAAWIKAIRRGAFVLASSTLTFSVVSRSWEPSLQDTAVVGGGVTMLLVNYIALLNRKPSEKQAKTVRWRAF